MRPEEPVTRIRCLGIWAILAKSIDFEEGVPCGALPMANVLDFEPVMAESNADVERDADESPTNLDASRCGGMAAEVLELRRLLTESRERERELRNALDASGSTRDGRGGVESRENRSTTEHIQRLSERLHLIESSKGWRLLQLLRGLVGRRW